MAWEAVCSLQLNAVAEIALLVCLLGAEYRIQRLETKSGVIPNASQKDHSVVSSHAHAIAHAISRVRVHAYRNAAWEYEYTFPVPREREIEHHAN
jgi:hypothetical protein